MHLTTEWDNDEKTIMRVTYHPGWTWDDLEANLPKEEAMLDSVDHTVNVIADFRGTRLPPGAIVRLPMIASSPPYMHANSGMMVMVGSPVFMEEVVGIYKRVFGQAQKLTVVGTLEEARALIVANRQLTQAAPQAPSADQVKPQASSTDQAEPQAPSQPEEQPKQKGDAA
ncbi:MAG: hypothetical protein JXJ20_13130 [Anaerolineae bacterium]|nr:hypothetical protein [Anaerolineae bacterium]